MTEENQPTTDGIQGSGKSVPGTIKTMENPHTLESRVAELEAVVAHLISATVPKASGGVHTLHDTLHSWYDKIKAQVFGTEGASGG